MEWTQKELEELYQRVNKLGASDADFRKELMADPHAAIEKIAGRELPEGFRLKFIENDPSYNATYLVPDFTPDELNLKALQTDAGETGEENSEDTVHPKVGVSFVLIVSACAAAVSTVGCGGDACAAAGCVGDACAAQACAAAGCGGNAGCAGNACAAAGCGADLGCAADGCGGNVCAANLTCLTNACGADYCAGFAECSGAICGADRCSAFGGCTGVICAAAAG